VCMSPDEMKSARIEEIVASYKAALANPEYAGDNSKMLRQQWEGTLANYEKLLKERAEAGTYDTAGQTPDQYYGRTSAAYR
jgi:hypothetical protein